MKLGEKLMIFPGSAGTSVVPMVWVTSTVPDWAAVAEESDGSEPSSSEQAAREPAGAAVMVRGEGGGPEAASGGDSGDTHEDAY